MQNRQINSVKGTFLMNLSFKQYRAVDLGIMLVILAVIEAVITYAATEWFPYELYVLSPTVAIVCIVMMRWGGFAAIHAVGGGLALCIASGADLNQFAVYCVGNCFALLALILLGTLGKEKVRSNPFLTVLFTVIAFCGAQVGRWLVGLIMGGSVGDIITFFATDSLSLIFALVTVLISRRINGLFEDQWAYLVRTQAERNKQQMGDYGDTEYGEGSDNYK